MGKSTIEWCHYTFNPWWGCVKISAGCKNCYAAQIDARFHRGEHWGVGAPRRFFGSDHWRQPHGWNREARKRRQRRRVFCASMADVFERVEDPVVADLMNAHRAQLWRLIAGTASLDWLLLTKRPENVCDLVPRRWLRGDWPSNAWLGVTAEDQARAAWRIPALLNLPAPVRFVSYEPALEAVDFAPWLRRWCRACGRHLLGAGPGDTCGTCHARVWPAIDWLIAGGESGPGARPMSEEWVRAARDQAAAAGVPFFYKQRLDERRRKISLPVLDGRRWSEFPEVSP